MYVLHTVYNTLKSDVCLSVMYCMSHNWHVFVTWLSLGCHVFVMLLLHMAVSQNQLTQECLKQAGLVSTECFHMQALPSTLTGVVLLASPFLQYSLHHHHAVRAASLYLQGTLATHSKDSLSLLGDLSNGCNDGDARVRTAALKALVSVVLILNVLPCQ